MSENKGFLAIWCDIDAADLADYRAWITREHIADRTLLPGWLGARFCVAIDNPCSHFFLYATQSAQVFSAAPYIQVLNNPSPWTRRIMPRFGAFDRALGEQLFKLGNGYGAYLMVARIRHFGALEARAAQRQLQPFLELPGVVSVRCMRLDRAATDIQSQEKTMRSGPEGDFHFLLVVEALSEQGALDAQARAQHIVPQAFAGADKIDSSVRKVIYGETAFEAACPLG